MGNISSQVAGAGIQKYNFEQSSRTKVLPIGTATAILRPTQNGEILQAGGTLTKTKRASYEKMCRSEPDLRIDSESDKKSAVNLKPKKYKAPSRPADREFRTKRLGLYKTRIESRLNSTKSINEDRTVEVQNATDKSPMNNYAAINNHNREYGIQLLKERSYVTQEENKPEENEPEENELEENGPEENDLEENDLEENELQENELDKKKREENGLELNGLEKSELQVNEPEEKSRYKTPQRLEMKKFYFGMEESKNYSTWITPDSSDSDERQFGEETEKISLRLRPHLPKRRLELPRFSPGSAWKLLRIDSPPFRDYDDDDGIPELSIHEDVGFLEAKIIEPSILRSDMAYFQDKSGDSGISGDDSPKIFNRYGNEKSWTPQQDLGNDSSIDDETTSTPSFTFPHRPHIFSLSLPRDRDLKRSISGPFSTELRVPELFETSPFPNSNWFLSKSAPNSLNNGFNSFEDPDPRQSRGRVMYLPGGTNHIDPPSNKKANQKKFSFQNTIRQIERRKLAEKLGKQAEIKERQRLEEIEVMRRIEEEFRRKRYMPR